MQKETAEVQLDLYRDAYRPALAGYELSEEQARYSGLPSDCLKDCEADDKRRPVVILYRSDPAGFMILHGWPGAEPFCQNRNALLLRAFSVDARYQHKGIATEALMRLDTFLPLHFPDGNEIVLGVNRRNAAAQHVYFKAGFQDSGKRVEGRYGEMLVLKKTLESAGKPRGL